MGIEFAADGNGRKVLMDGMETGFSIVKEDEAYQVWHSIRDADGLILVKNYGPTETISEAELIAKVLIVANRFSGGGTNGRHHS